MVDVNTQNKTINVNVSSSGVSSNVNASGDVTLYYSNKAKEWAISNRIVDGEDYSSKYYANKSQESATSAQTSATNASETYTQLQVTASQALEDLATTANTALENISNTEETSIANINTVKDDSLTEIETAKTTAVNTVNTTKNNAITQITQEGAEQVANIERTGFYMRDDKLYFINSKGEEEEFKSGAGAVMFDTKIADHILQGEEAIGWALQGSYVYKNSLVERVGYPDFYNKCLEEYKNEQNTKTVIKSNVNIVGSLTNNNGVLSGFSSTSWATLPNNFSPNSSNWEMFFKFTTGTIGTRQNIICSSQLAYQPVDGYIDTNGYFVFAGHLNNTSTTIFNIKGTTILKSDTTYYVKCEYDSNTGYSLKLGTDKDNLALEGNSTVTTIINNGYNIALGADFTTNGAYYDYAFPGTIDLKESYININGERWWTGASTAIQNPNGHKFYPIEQKSEIDKIYNQYGIADFYGIDEENERVFLPRNKYFHQLTDDISKVNEMVEAGLPNITGQFISGAYSFSNDQAKILGAFKPENQAPSKTKNAAAGEDNNILTSFDASRSSEIYGNSDAVQPPSSLKLLYYCVGNTEVTQAITNVTEVTTSENDTIPLFTGMYFDFKPNNLSWLKAGEQQNNAGIYKTCYDTLVEIVNGVNNYDLKVINQADMISGVNYDEYWVLDQDNLTFRTPLTITTKSLSGEVAGNGIGLGITDGTSFATLVEHSDDIQARKNYGENVGVVTSTIGTLVNNTIIGLTTDPTKSGIIAEQSTAQLYFKVANAVQNLELLDAGELMEAVNYIIPNNSELIAKYSIPDLTAGATLTSGSELPCDALVYYNGTGGGTVTDVGIKFTYNGVGTFVHSVASTYAVYNSIVLPKGTIITANSKTTIKYYPLKGVK